MKKYHIGSAVSEIHTGKKSLLLYLIGFPFFQCPVQGRQRLEALLERVALTSNYKVSIIIINILNQITALHKKP